MDKLFRFDRRFIWFCALLVAVWLLLQFVIIQRIKGQAALAAAQLFTWNWPCLKARSEFAGRSVKILKHSDTEVIVEVTGLQKVYRERQNTLDRNDPDQIGTPLKSKASKCSGVLPRTQRCDTYTVSTVLSFYKMNGNWLLGRVGLR